MYLELYFEAVRTGRADHIKTYAASLASVCRMAQRQREPVSGSMPDRPIGEQIAILVTLPRDAT